MPTYTVEDVETGEVSTHVVPFETYERMLAENPRLRRVYTSPAAIGDSVRLGKHKPDRSFRELLKHVKRQHRGSTINDW